METAIIVIWAVMLAVTLLVVVPVVLVLLSRLLNVARSIERYTADALAGGVDIAQHTENVTALNATAEVVGQLVAGAEAIERHAATIEIALAAQKSSNGHGPPVGGAQ